MSTVVVIGATGRTGRHLVHGLLDAGVAVRALVRHPPTAHLPEAVMIFEGSIEDTEALTRAAAGADAAFLLWPGFDDRAVGAAVAALAEQVELIVYLSAAQLQGGRHGVMEGVWSRVEAAIEASGASWSFVRAGGFAANTLQWAEALRAGNVVRTPFPEAARPLVHERDLAEVALRTLLDPGLQGQAFEVTGSESLTQRQQVETIGTVLHRPIRIEPQPLDEARAALGEYADAALGHWRTLVHDPEEVRDGVQEVLGRPPRSFAEWVGDHAEDFAQHTTAEVADAYAAALGSGDMAAAGRLLADDVVRVAPLESNGLEAEVRGRAAITDNATAQMAGVTVDGVVVDPPLTGGDRFALRFAFAETERATGTPRETVKLSLCTVRAARIVREEVFYYAKPGGADA